MKKFMPFLLIGTAIFSCMALKSNNTSLPSTEATIKTLSSNQIFNFETIIAPQYEDGFVFSDGLAAVKKNGKWGYINTKGDVVIDFIYDDAAPFNEGRALVGRRTTESPQEVALGIVDTTGFYSTIMTQWVNEEGNTVNGQFYAPLSEENPSANFFDISNTFHQGMVAFHFDDTSRLFNIAGQEIFSTYYTMGLYNEGYLYIEHNGNVHLSCLSDFSKSIPLEWMKNINTGEGVIGGIGVNQNLFAAFYQESVDSPSLLGFLDIDTLQWVITPQYSDFFYGDIYGSQVMFGETGLAIVTKDGTHFGAINKKNETIIPFDYEELWPFSNGLAPFKQNGLMGYLDHEGTIVIKPTYDYVTGFSSIGLAVVVSGENAWLIDQKGNGIPNTNQIDSSTYLTYNEHGLTAYAPEEYVLIRTSDGVGYGKVSYTPPLPTEEELNEWSHHLIVEAIERNLIPISLQNRYSSPITREEFATLMVTTLTKVRNSTVEELVLYITGNTLFQHMADYPFLDCSEDYVIAAYALGLINGTGDRKFQPYETITRQEAAVMLTSMASLGGQSTTVTENLLITDREWVDTWALSSVAYVYLNNIMGSTGHDAFSPLDLYTREQAFVTMNNMYELLS